MADWAEVEFSFERGVNTFDRPSVLPDGTAQAIENFDWLPNGGLVPRPAWKAAGASPTGSPASGARAGRGQFLRWYESGVRKLVVATKDAGNAFSFYKTNVADPTTFGSYTAIHTALAIASAQAGDIVRFAVGNNKLVYTNPGFPSGQLRRYDGTTADAIATSNIAGRTIVYHLNRFWTGGGLTDPTFLRFSEIGDETAWVVEENFIPVGQNDGEPVEDVVLWDRGLVIGKQHSLWFLAGREPGTPGGVRLEPISDTIGCARGKALIPTEHGIMVLGLDGQVYVYDGADVRPLTEHLQVSVPVGYVSGAWTHGKLYVRTAADQTVWCYEPEMQRWRKEITLDTVNAPQDLDVFDDHYLLVTSAGATGRVHSVRSEHGVFASGSYRDPVHDAGVAENFVANTQEIWPQQVYAGKATLRHVYVRYRQWASGSTPKLTITPVADGVVGSADTIGGKAAAGTYIERVDMNSEGRSFELRFTSSPTNAENPAYSIEEVSGRLLVERGPR